MKRSYSVGEFKARFPEALKAVKEGNTVSITYGRSHRLVAVLSPPDNAGKPRKLGRLKGTIKARPSDDWSIDDTEFLSS